MNTVLQKGYFGMSSTERGVRTAVGVGLMVAVFTGIITQPLSIAMAAFACWYFVITAIMAADPVHLALAHREEWKQVGNMKYSDRGLRTAGAVSLSLLLLSPYGLSTLEPVGIFLSALAIYYLLFTAIAGYDPLYAAIDDITADNAYDEIPAELRPIELVVEQADLAKQGAANAEQFRRHA